MNQCLWGQLGVFKQRTVCQKCKSTSGNTTPDSCKPQKCCCATARLSSLVIRSFVLSLSGFFLPFLPVLSFAPSAYISPPSPARPRTLNVWPRCPPCAHHNVPVCINTDVSSGITFPWPQHRPRSCSTTKCFEKIDPRADLVLSSVSVCVCVCLVLVVGGLSCENISLVVKEVLLSTPSLPPTLLLLTQMVSFPTSWSIF